MPLRQIQQDAERIFQPQVRNIQQQLGQVGSLFDPQRESLQQAQRNLFRDVDADATQRGLFHSGAPITGRAKVLSEQIAPQRAQIDQSEAQQGTSLAQALQDILIRQGESVLGRFDTRRAEQQQQRLSREQIASQERIAREQTRATLRSA